MILNAVNSFPMKVKAAYVYNFGEHPWSQSPATARPDVIHVQFINSCKIKDV